MKSRWYASCFTQRMIELHLYLRAPPRQTQSLVAALQSLARLAGLERGCLEAHVFTESNDPRHLYYSEAWDAEENLRSMLRSERFTHLVELMELAAEPPSLAFWTISETRGLEFARQARQGQSEGAFTFDSGNGSHPESKVNAPSFLGKTTGLQP